MVELRCHLYNEFMGVAGQSRKDASTLTTQVFHAKAKTFLATWNARTLSTWERLKQGMKEMIKYQIDIPDLCEMRWTVSGKIVNAQIDKFRQGMESAIGPDGSANINDNGE